VYAGAVREAVFAVPQVIRKVNAEFIPLALKATLVNHVAKIGDKDEAKFYEGIKRVMLAPQGVGILNSNGHVLNWVQMFENDPSVLDFLDHGSKRFRDGAKSSERHMKFPSEKTKDVEHGDIPSLPEAHAKGRVCPAKGQAKGYARKGDLVAQVVGRALDKDGKPVADTVRQEHYIQDQFSMSAKAFGEDPTKIPEPIAKLWVMHAYLGHIDVRPMNNPAGGSAEVEKVEFTIKKDGDWWRIEGASEIVQTKLTNGEGRHEVKLAWEGYAEMDRDGITLLVLMANGTERLKFQNGRIENEVARLPGGRPIDLSCRVRYGIIATPSTSEEVVPDDSAESDSLEQKMQHFQRALQGRLQKLMNEGKIDEAKNLLDRIIQQIDEPSHQGPPRELQQKMQKLQQAVKQWQDEGRDPTPIGRVMQKFEPLMKQGKFKEAEAVVDEALKVSEDK
jgi:hypothetical protein